MKLALGTVQFGLNYGIANNDGKVVMNEVRKILEYAKSKSILTLDTASSYGNSEQVLGKIGVQDYHIITKTISLKNGVNAVINNLYKSLNNLQIDRLYGLLIHNIEDMEDHKLSVLLNILNKLKEEGIIKKIGFSTYTPNQVNFLLKNFDFDLIQLPFSILDRRILDEGILAKLYKRGTEVHARSIFLQGLLIMSPKSRPKKFDRWSHLWTIWHKWLNDNKITPIEATLRYAISTPEISKVVFGVENLFQLKEIFIASNGNLPDIPKDFFTNDPDLLNPSNW